MYTNHNHPSPETEHALTHNDMIGSALSRFVGTTDISSIARLMPMLECLSRTNLHDESPRRAVPWSAAGRLHPETVLRRHGISLEALAGEFAHRKRLEGDRAQLDDALLCDLFPRPYWLIIDQLIEDGPVLAGRRIDVSIHEQAEQLVPPTAARPEGGLISKGTLSKRIQTIRRFLTTLVDLNRLFPDSGLEDWILIPKVSLDDLPNPEQVTDTTAPDLRLLRTVLADLNSRIESIIGCSGDAQIEAVRRRPDPSRLALFRLLQRRVELSLLCTVGMRVGALVRLNVGDIFPDRQRAGGGVGPAIALRPGKTVSRHTVRYKPIPQGLFQYVEIYLAYIEECLGRPLPAGNPLVISSLTKADRALTDKAVRAHLGQRVPRIARTSSGEEYVRYSTPLLPRPGGKSGYSPHTVRAAALQMIRSEEGSAWLRENRKQWNDPRLAVGDIALPMISEVLLDHAVGLDSLGYGGASKELDRERLSGYGTEINWALLTTDAGARKVPDVEAFRSALRQRLAVEDDLSRLDTVIQDTVDKTQSGEIGLEKGFLAFQRLRDEENRARDDLAVVKEQLRNLRDPGSFIPLADDLELISVDLNEIEKQLLGGRSEYERRRFEPLRDWITPKELGEVLGLGDMTIRRWLNGLFPSGLQPWDPDHPPVDYGFGPKRRRILVSGLNNALFPSELAKEKLAETLARWPKGWSRAATADHPA